MGFAGQVFAARVAIGLAVPSRKSLTATGQVLAAGVKDIHRRIKQQAMASSLDSIHRARLEKLNKSTASAAARTANLLKVKLEQNLKQLNGATQKSINEAFGKTGRQYDKLRQKLSKPIKQAFKGMDNLTGLKAAQQLARNMSMMSKRDRMAVVNAQKRVVNLLDMELNRKRRILTMGYKEAQITKATYNLIKKEAAEERKALDLEKERLKVLTQIEGEVGDVVDEMKEMNDEGESWGQQVSGAADQIKENFNEALRNSVAILAAFGYKLQQSTAALVEFEKELLNANSVFNLTNDSLFNVGNEIIKFGNNFGIATQNGATGLYQLASAGLSADDAMKVLPETLKLSMAVQGDHNTISKLTAQTLFGFGMEMDQAAIVTDKFAYAIQKSLIEYQDLGSAVKFALPFFTSTGQSIDQLLGALQVLTNRALEAGIAGRGLRQALAEFAEGAMDAEAGFRKMGVEILNSKGEMLQLTEIASQFAAAVGPETMSNTELLTTLIDDLNVRGATAFIHLVQASDEFTEAVENTANAGGQLDEMVRIQNQSLSAQIQILRTNVFSIFAFRDAAFEGTDYINAFHKSIVTTVGGLRDLIIVEEDGEQRLTELGQRVQDLSVVFVEQFGVVLEETITLLSNLASSGKNFEGVIKLLFTPLKLIASVINKIPPGLLEMYLYWRMINAVVPLGTLAMWSYSRALMAVAAAQIAVNATSMLPGGLGAIGGPLTKKGLPDMRFAANKIPKGAVVKTAGMLGGAALGFSGLGTIALLAGLGGAYMLSKQASGGYVSPRAGGGMAGGNSPYLVGEQGPELFVPGNSGEIFNNKQTGDMLGSGQVILKNVTIGIDSFGGLV